MFYDSSELWGGMDVGLFLDLGWVKGLISCLKFCCEIELCDLVFMMCDSCYVVDCYNNKLCEFVLVDLYRSDMFSVYYVIRSGKLVLDESEYIIVEFINFFCL